MKKNADLPIPSTSQFSLAFLARQLTLFCLMLALLKYFLWLSGIEAHLEMGNETANYLHLLVSVVILGAFGAFVGGHWSRAWLGVALGGAVGLFYGVMNWSYVIACPGPMGIACSLLELHWST